MMSSERKISSTRRRSRCREGQMFHLVKMYHNHRCLWDRSHPDYKNRTKRFDSFKAIGLAFNLTSLEDVKKKIKSMRDTYTAEKNRMKKSMKADPGSDDVYRTKLSWYSFADSFFNNKEAKSSEIKLKPETIDDPLGPEDEDCTIIPPYEHQYTDLTEMDCHYDDQSTLDSSDPVHQYPKNTSKSNAVYEQEIPDDVEIEPDDSEDIYPSSSGHDEFYYFGMNVASQLRALPKINALVLQDKIHKLIFNERLQFESHSTFQHHQTNSTVDG